jgi:hypothetical protein
LRCCAFLSFSWRESSALDPLEGFIAQLLKHKQLPADTVLHINKVSCARFFFWAQKGGARKLILGRGEGV